MEGISLQELQVGFISILLYEIGRLLVDWWYPPDFQTDPESLKLGSSPDQPQKLGPALEYTYWWYTRQGRKAIDRAFFGSVVEFWVHKPFVQCTGVGGHFVIGSYFVPQPVFKLEDIRGLGFHMCKVDTVLGASPLFNGWSVHCC